MARSASAQNRITGGTFTTTTTTGNIHWQKLAPGVWKGVAGNPDTYNLLKAAGCPKPALAALENMGDQPFPLPIQKIQASFLDHKTMLRLPLQKEELIYGLGLQFKSVNRRGSVSRLHVDHYGGKDDGRTHAPVPFYVSSAGYGVLINAARYITVYAGSAVRKDSPEKDPERNRNEDKAWQARPYSDAMEILVPAEGTELYVFAGPTTLDAVRRFNLFNGGGPLPPRWGLGFTQRVKSLYTSDQVTAEVDSFRRKGFPLDFVGLEPGWQSKAYPGTFSWDNNRYPDPAAFVREMLDKDIRLNLWINPYVSKSASFYDKISPYTASHLVWQGAVPDFTMARARELFFGQLEKDQVDLGVSGYKIDEVDGYDYYLWPDVSSFPGGATAEQMRQTYGVLAMRYSLDMFKKKNLRTYGLVRGSNAGANSFPYVIYDDYYNHEDFITALINSGFIGILWTPEVRASKSAEEWVRRFQTAIFSPMAMINAWSSGTKPWSYPEVAQAVKKLALLRMEMMPYWYSEFAKYHFEGTPVFRGMALEPGFKAVASTTVKGSLEDNPYLEAVRQDIKDQYMAGASLLVAPLFSGQTSRKVILPKGKWFDFYTGDYVGDAAVITAAPGLDKIPVYVKNGGVIPMRSPALHAPGPGEQVDLEVRVYGDTVCNYDLYDDDGLTLDYEKGAYEWRRIVITKDAAGHLQGAVTSMDAGRTATAAPAMVKNQFMIIKQKKNLQKKHFTYNKIRFRFMTGH